MRCACAISVCEKDDFGALRLRVRPRAKTLSPAARALGGGGSFSRLDAARPRPSLPFARCARSSAASRLGARRASAATPLIDAAGRSADKPHLAALGWGDRGSRACAWRAGRCPPEQTVRLGPHLLPLLRSLPLAAQVSASVLAPPKALALNGPAIAQKHARPNRPWGLTKAFA